MYVWNSRLEGNKREQESLKRNVGDGRRWREKEERRKGKERGKENREKGEKAGSTNKNGDEPREWLKMEKIKWKV